MNEKLTEWQNMQKSIIKKRFKIPLYYKILSLFENIAIFFIICLRVIFRPLNLVIFGIILLVIIYLI